MRFGSSRVRELLPVELRELPQWVLWRYEDRDGKRTKVPYRTDKPKVPASSTDPSTWSTHADALRTADADGVDGIGFVFAESDPYTGIDFDHCVDGEDINPHVANVMRQLDSYSEFSPSGTGLHVIIRAEVNGDRRRTGNTPWDGEFENYDRGRFFCMTGRHIRDTPRTINDRQQQLDAVRARIFAPKAERKPPPVVTIASADNRELLALARNAKNGPKFASLYDAAEHSYGSDSEADLALCDLLAFWCGSDVSRIDQLFRGSARMREKWDSTRGESTYGAQTIEKALASRTEFYGSRQVADKILSPTSCKVGAEISAPENLKPSHLDETDRPAVLFTPADELLAKAPREPDWLWEHAAAKGAVSLFAGKPKVGKSTMTYGLVEAAAKGEGEFLGRTLHGGPIVYATEEGQATLGSTFPRHPKIHLATRESAWPKPGWRELITSAAAKVRETGAVLAVIDTFSFWNGLGPDAEKDSGSVQPLLDALVEITQTGCAVWLAHHHRKGGGEDGDALRGTTAIAGGVDCFCELEKIEDAPANHRRLVITPRWTTPPVLITEYDEVFGHRVIGQAADREHSSEVGWTDRLLEAIPDSGEGSTMDDLAECLGADRRKWHKNLTALIDNKRVQRTGKGTRYDPYRHLRLAVPSSRPDGVDGRDGSHPGVQPSRRIHTAGCTAAANSVVKQSGTAGRLPTADELQQRVREIAALPTEAEQDAAIAALEAEAEVAVA